MLEKLIAYWVWLPYSASVLSKYLSSQYSINLSNCKHRIGFAARLAGHWSNGHFIAVVLHLGWTFNLGLLFVNLYFYIFNQQRFRADEQWIPALQQALPVACKPRQQFQKSWRRSLLTRQASVSWLYILTYFDIGFLIGSWRRDNKHRLWHLDSPAGNYKQACRLDSGQFFQWRLIGVGQLFSVALSYPDSLLLGFL